MKVTVINALSGNMLPWAAPSATKFTLSIERVTVEDAARLLRAADQVENLIGHPTTDALIRGMLTPHGVDLPPGQRGQVSVLEWVDGYPLLVAQYIGPRLPEGATVLPAGASIVWLLVGCRSGQYHCSTCSDSMGAHCAFILETELRLAGR